MNKTFESLKNYIIEADTSISDLLDLYIKKSAELDNDVILSLNFT